MNRETERLLEDMRNVIGELETLLSQPAEHLEKVAGNVEQTLRGLRHRMNDLQSEIQRRISDALHEADRSIREHPWAAIAIAATALLLLGVALGSRPRSERSQ